MSYPLKLIQSKAVTDTILVGSNVPEDDHSEWSSGTTYAKGARVIVTATHKIYESVADSNIGNNPTAVPSTHWVEVSATNKWKPFDLSTTSQGELTGSSYYEFYPGVAVNSLAMVNIAGLSTVRVRLTDPSFGVVYDKTVNVRYAPASSSWYSWFFGQRTERTSLLLTDLPSYPTATLRVDIESVATGKVGALLFGTQRSVGSTVRSGARLGITDYSRKERTDFGDVILVQRAFSKRASLDIVINNDDLDNVYNLLSEVRATPCLWFASDRFSSLIIFGYYNNFEIVIPYRDVSDCSIDLEGLV